ncbi:MAG: HD domain-containing phosphohydrolase [Gemmatimonadota bacterium]
MRVLVVDDMAYNRRALRSICQSVGYEVASAPDGQAALDMIRTEPPELVITDILMPRLDGFQLCRAIKTDDALKHVPVIVYTGSYTDPADREFGVALGASAYLIKPLEPRELLAEVAKVVGGRAPEMKARRHLGETWAAAYADRLAAKLQEKVTELNQTVVALEDAYTGTVAALNLALSEREGGNPIDAERPAHLAQLFCERVAPELAADPNVFRGFLLHDIGKLMLPDGLLKKAGPLTDEERGLIKRQPGIAADILRNVPGLGRALEIVRYHHEWWDGNGYPEGLKGEAIPLGARIFSLADAFEAMTTGRPHRAGRPADAALGELRRASGTQFDPNLVEPFTGMVEEMQGR